MVGGTNAADDEKTDSEHPSPTSSDADYGSTDVVRTSGCLDLHVGMDGTHETKVQVSSRPEGIGLQLSNQLGAVGVTLLPEDIEPLCRELLDAKAKTRPEYVENRRDRIVEQFRNGDA